MGKNDAHAARERRFLETWMLPKLRNLRSLSDSFDAFCPLDKQVTAITREFLTSDAPKITPKIISCHLSFPILPELCTHYGRAQA